MAFQAIATHWSTTKRAATLTSPQGRGSPNLQGKSSLYYGFPSHSNPLVTTKRAATLTSPQGRGGANLQGKSSLCYGFPSHSNPLVYNKKNCNFNLSSREGSPNLQGKSSLYYGFPSYSNPLVNNKRAATLTPPQGRGARTCKENHHCVMAFQAIATHWLTTKELPL